MHLPSRAPTAHRTVRSLFQSLGLPLDSLESNLHLTGDPRTTLPSSFNLGIAAQASIAACGLSAALLHKLRTGESQNVTVNARHAALEFRSEAYYTINGIVPGEIWDDLAGVYPTKDDSFVRIHTNFPHHRNGILSMLGLSSASSREEVAMALLLWNSKDFETEAAWKGMCATAMRSLGEWDKHPQAQAIKDVPPVQLIKIADAPKRPLNFRRHTNHPLSGIRVLDLTRVLAGPVCGRTLAAHGADVLLITSPKLPSLPKLDADTSRGKRTTQLDLTTAIDVSRLWSLVHESDVFLQGYRPGGLADKGFSAAALASARPGIVCANLTAWGWEGPWKDNRGFDSLVQIATGLSFEESQAFAAFNGETIAPEASSIPNFPKPFPLQALDHSAAYLLALGINAALGKTMTEGGSWEVRVSLAGVGNWVRSLGRLGRNGFQNPALPNKSQPPAEEITPLLTELYVANTQNELRGTMAALKHSAILDKTPVIEKFVPVGLDVDSPDWLS